MPVKRACDVCFKRKIQCTRTNPNLPCEWCFDHNLECVLQREAQRKKSDDLPSILNHVQALTRRVTELENTVEQLRSAVNGITPVFQSQNTPLSLPGTVNTQASPLSPQPHHAGSAAQHRAFLGQHWYFKGVPLFSEKGTDWMSSKIGQRPNLGKFRLFGSLSFPPTPFQPRAELPEREIVNEVLESWLSSDWQRLYPVLDSLLVPGTIEAAYTLPPSQETIHRQKTAEACILAALAICSRASGYEIPELLEGDAYANLAHSYLAQVSDGGNLETLEALLLLVLYKTLSGQWEDATTLHSSACRIVYELKGHCFYTTFAEQPSEQHKREHVRDLFWLCYIFDKDLSIRFGQPPLLPSNYCDLTLPDGLGRIYDTLPLNEKAFVHFPQDLQLTQIKERLCLFLCSLDNPNLADSTILFHLRQLDIDLETWRLNIPVDFRPKLSLSADQPFQLKMSHLQRRRHTHLQLEYSYMTIIIHTAVRRCGAAYAMNESLPDDLHNVYHSSSDLSLEAGRTILQTVKDPDMLLEQHAFGHVAFYPPIAALALFLNILIHPLDKEAQMDLDILASSTTIFQNSSSTRMTELDLESVQELSRFVSELVRLGKSAILKAKQESQATE
ncbi:hypothetical protein EDB82DRAFT_319368 [Fusarium venenatum]|uniref:uncharacterized protein n=1 Tax=Fusarium venenatum TaxID=56646 RepID=UPI001D95B44B|nr:hypothetical protein EDB82DRAFT_319368 [Fusarium venenatum]